MNATHSIPLSSKCTAMLAVSCLVLVVSAQSASADEEEGAEKQNVVSLILGGTSDRDENVFTVGLDFEHRIHPLLGVGAVIEYATDDLDAVTLIGALDLHIWKGFAIQTGPGVEFGGLLVTPQVHDDYSSGNDSVVYAMGLGFKF